MSESFTYKNLIAGDYPIVTSEATILSGSNLSAGTVLGKVSVGSVPTTGTADGGNTGDGTVTAVTGGVDTKVGVYSVECIEAATNSGTFKIVDPDGNEIGQAIVPAGAGNDIDFTSSQINLTITDGSTDFAVGDIFTITVPAGSGKFVAVDSTAIDGSGNPHSVLLADTDASGGDAVGPVALSGEFNENQLTFGGSDTADTHRDAARDKNIYFRPVVKTTGVSM